MAFSVAKFIQKGGSFINYYMVLNCPQLLLFEAHRISLNDFIWSNSVAMGFQYHGGTNFGRTSGGPFIATSYDYDAPLDEYGM